MKKIITSIAFVVLFAVSAYAQTACTRHVESAGRFSYCPPAGWIAKDVAPDSPYKAFFTVDGASLRANVNVKDEATTVSNDAYVAAALRFLLAENEGLGDEARKVIGWTEFTTDSNIKGSRLVYEVLYKGMLLRSVQYVLDFPTKKLLITGTSLMSDKNTTDKIFEGVAKSVRLQ